MRTSLLSKSSDSRTAVGDLGASGSGRAGADPKVVVGLEVSHDPATCTSQFAVATYPADNVPQVVAERYAAPDEANRAGKEASPEAAAVSWYGYISGFYRDPPGIRVTWTWTSHRWKWDSSKGGDCAEWLGGGYYLDAP